MADGTIKIDTRLDNTQIGNDIEELRAMIKEGTVDVTDEAALKVDKLALKYNKILLAQQENKKHLDDLKANLADVITLSETYNDALKHEQSLREQLQAFQEIRKDKTLPYEERQAALEREKQLHAELEETATLIKRIQEEMAALGTQEQLSQEIAKATQKTKELELDMQGVALNTKEIKQNMEQTEPAVEKVRKGMSLNLKTIARYAGYLVGMRAVYSGIMKAVNAWFRTTEEGLHVQQQLQGVWTALGQTLSPIITRLVSLLRTLLGYMNAITKGLFGFALFSQTATKSLGGAVKHAKELRKQLAGFDEMNILQADSGGGAGADAGVPSLDIEEPDLSWIERVKPIIDSLIDTFTKLWEIIKKVAGWLWEHFIAGLEFLSDLLLDTDMNVGDVIATLMLLYGTFKLLQLLGGMTPLGWIVLAIAGIIVALGWLSKNWDEIKDKVTNFFINFKQMLNDQLDAMGLWGDFIRERLETIWFFFRDTFLAVKRILSGIIDFVIGAFTGDWERAWKGVQNIFGSIWNALVALAKFPINLIIDGINTFLRGLNRLKVPSWVPAVGGRGFSIPLIPKLAKGALVTQATTAIVGDAGREAVIPLENNTEWAHDFLDVLDNYGGMGSGTITNIIHIDGKEVARQTRKLDKDEQFRKGGLAYGN